MTYVIAWAIGAIVAGLAFTITIGWLDGGKEKNAASTLANMDGGTIVLIILCILAWPVAIGIAVIGAFTVLPVRGLYFAARWARRHKDRYVNALKTLSQ